MPAPEADLLRLHCDSRRVDPETAFFALRGLQTDGHRFIDAALAAGAPALFVSDPERYARLTAQPRADAAGPAVFLAAPGRASLADVAAAIHGYPHRELRLLGVTGTSGKSTVVHLVEQLLAALGQPCARLGTQGLRRGAAVQPSARTTPEAPDIQAFLRQTVDAGVGTAAMEATSIGIELERTRGLAFAAAAFTNLSQDHLDFHGDMAAYREAKYRLFLEYDTAAAVVNADDPAGALLVERLRETGRGERALTCSLAGSGDLTLGDLRAEGGTTTGAIRWRGAQAAFRYGLLGRFNLSNLLTALGLLLATGEPLEALAPAVARCTGPAGRFERVALDAPFTVIVDYAHKPAALELVLAAARPLTDGRLHVLFGCGGDRDRGKRPQMGAIAERLADRVVLSNDNPRSEDPDAILAEIAAGMQGTGPTQRIADREAAIHALLDDAKPGDLLVIAGKGDEAYQELDGRSTPFDDRAVALAWGRARGYGAPG